MKAIDLTSIATKTTDDLSTHIQKVGEGIADEFIKRNEQPKNIKQLEEELVWKNKVLETMWKYCASLGAYASKSSYLITHPPHEFEKQLDKSLYNIWLGLNDHKIEAAHFRGILKGLGWPKE